MVLLGGNMRDVKLSIVPCCLMILLLGSFSTAQTYTVTDLGTLPGYKSSLAYYVNTSGQATGCSDNSTSQSTLCVGESASSAYYWSPDTGMVNLGSLAGYDAIVGVTINDSEEIVGLAQNSQTGISQGFIWTQLNGLVELLPLPGGSYSVANANNNNGTIVGYSSVSNGDVHGVLWEPSGNSYQIKDLGVLPGGPYSYAYDVNQNKQVVGEAYNSAGTKFTAFLWSPAAGWKNLGTLPGGQDSIADWINDPGVAVGGAYTTQYPNGVAVYWDTSYQIHSLGTLPGGTQSYAGGENNPGEIVGESSVPGGVLHACIWKNGIIKDLNNLIPPNSGWVLNHASAISKVGKISGFGTINGQTHGVILTPMP
jgi:probable HAF family extracellular repeat protein